MLERSTVSAACLAFCYYSYFDEKPPPPVRAGVCVSVVQRNSRKLPTAASMTTRTGWKERPQGAIRRTMAERTGPAW